MLKDVLNKELVTLEINAEELKELGEVMAGGAGCQGSSCSGTCTEH